MSLFPAPDAKRTRIDLKKEDVEKHVRGIDEGKVNAIVRVLDGGGLDLLKARVMERFGTEITKDSGAGGANLEITGSDDQSIFKAKRDAAFQAAVSAGMHTLSMTFGFRRINFTRASLFKVGSEYAYSDGDTDADWKESLAEDRRNAFHDRRMARLDLLSCGIGSSACYVTADARGYTYHPFDPTKIWVLFADQIMIGDDEEKATVDKTDFEDASLIVIQLAEQPDEEGGNSYLAFQGRSMDLPNGRMVKYQAETWSDMPAVGEGGAEYTLDGEFVIGAPIGEVANPLTVYQNESGDYKVEYPIFNWQMDQTADGTSVFPISGTTLFDVLFDLDVEYSRDIESSGRSARGAWYADDPHALGFSKSLSEGESVMKRDQSATLLSHPASNAQQATEILQNALEQAAGAYNVPGYKVTTKESFQAQSGFALKIMDQPLTEDRLLRTRINESSSMRKFWIERALANAYNDTETIPTDVDELWKPGSLDTLETAEESRAQLDWEFEKGLRSIGEYAQDMANIETKEQALEMLAQNKEENAAFVKQQAQQQQGPGGLITRAPRVVQ
jgi:hypothetical protein